MEEKLDGRMERVRDDLIEILRDKIKELGDPNNDWLYDLVDNQYGFASAWIEDDVEVWWDKKCGAMQMDEVTELAALYNVICETESKQITLQ